MVDAEGLFYDAPLPEGVIKHVPETPEKGVETVIRPALSIVTMLAWVLVVPRVNKRRKIIITEAFFI